MLYLRCLELHRRPLALLGPRNRRRAHSNRRGQHRSEACESAEEALDRSAATADKVGRASRREGAVLCAAHPRRRLTSRSRRRTLGSRIPAWHGIMDTTSSSPSSAPEAPSSSHSGAAVWSSASSSASSTSSTTTPPPSQSSRCMRLCDHEPPEQYPPGSAARLFSDPSADPPIFYSRTSDPNPVTAFMPQPPSLREPHPPDLLPRLPDDRPTLAEFRAAEGPRLRAAKLRALWESLPDLPAPSAGPTETALAQLPGQGTLSPLSSERAERLRRLYQEELVKRVTCERPEAKLWGGPDSENEPDTQAGAGTGSASASASASGSQGETSAAGAGRRGKGIAWKDFR